jgi:alcohol dehydrogenase class IV
VRFINQQVLIGIEKIRTVFSKVGIKKAFIVCDSSFKYLNVKNYIELLSVQKEFFSNFTPNPLYEDVKKGVEQFNRDDYDCILAIGGGSTIDVAKCIKLFSKMDHSKNYLEQEYKSSRVPLVAIPTTAGTGSESTRYAVIYYKGEKQSITHESIIPDYAILEPSILQTLPLYQKKCAMLDALCQGIESWWSVNSTDESKSYSKIAVETIIAYMDTYLTCDMGEAAKNIMIAANYAGHAINITQTTAAHAMSYKLTSMYKLPHGHAVAICFVYNGNMTTMNNVSRKTHIYCAIF